MQVRELFEKAVVFNAARVVEEVRVSREVHEREEVIEDKLRRKEVDVQRMAVSQERECAFATGQYMELTGSHEDKLGVRSLDRLKKKADQDQGDMGGLQSGRPAQVSWTAEAGLTLPGPKQGLSPCTWLIFCPHPVE